MTVEKDWLECFREVIGHVDQCVDAVKEHKIAFYPFQSEKYLMSMCRVCGVGFCTFPIAVHPSLSSYRRVAASCGMLRSQRMLLTNRIILPVQADRGYAAEAFFWGGRGRLV
jgi:hypothetical protein